MLTIDAEALKPVIAACVAEVMAEMVGKHDRAGDPLPDGRLCWSEAEAAAMLGLNRWQLRDERRRGRVSASVLIGKRIRYTREDLAAYLNRGRLEAGA